MKTVNLGNSEGMPMFLYYDHTVNRSIALVLVTNMTFADEQRVFGAV